MTQLADKKSIVVLLGYDGSGKSTLLHMLRYRGFSTSSWKDLRSIPECSHMMGAGACPETCRSKLPPLSRATFVINALFAEYEFVIEPALKRSDLVIVESYFPRPVAKELLKNLCDPQVLNLAFLLPTPTAVIVVAVNPMTAFLRNGLPELHDVFAHRTFEDYRNFQAKVLDTALSMVPDVPVYYVDGNLPEDAVYDQVQDIVSEKPWE